MKSSSIPTSWRFWRRRNKYTEMDGVTESNVETGACVEEVTGF